MGEKEFDNQTTGMAGEFLTVGKLFKKGLQTTVTFGNAKGIDILAENPEGKIYKVQVKTSRKNKENFRMQENKIKPDYICVFVVLNDFGDKEDYYIVRGSEILNDVNKFFGQTYNKENPPKGSAIRYKALTEYQNKWNVFEE